MKDVLILSRYPVEIQSSLSFDTLVFEGESLAEFYNSKKETGKQYATVLFLDGRYSLRSKTSLDELYAQLISSPNLVSGIYSDTVMTGNNNEVLSYHCNQSYSPELIAKGVFIDSGLLVKSAGYPTFDTNLSHLLVYESILSAVSNSAVIRCPKFCFTRNLYCHIPNNEIVYIRKKHYESK